MMATWLRARLSCGCRIFTSRRKTGSITLAVEMGLTWVMFSRSALRETISVVGAPAESDGPRHTHAVVVPSALTFLPRSMMPCA
ncbi:hypothetical protein FIBSPDRAFT_862032, partial [Athelia psychrophila]